MASEPPNQDRGSVEERPSQESAGRWATRQASGGAKTETISRNLTGPTSQRVAGHRAQGRCRSQLSQDGFLPAQGFAEQVTLYALQLWGMHSIPPEFSVYSGQIVKKAALIALVVLVLVVGLPFAMGMPDMASCPRCTGVDTPLAIAMCLAIVSLFVWVVPSRGTRIASRRALVRLLLFDDPPERPPRVA